VEFAQQPPKRHSHQDRFGVGPPPMLRLLRIAQLLVIAFAMVSGVVLGVQPTTPASRRSCFSPRCCPDMGSLPIPGVVV
jgi:hypothetical protein